MDRYGIGTGGDDEPGLVLVTDAEQLLIVARSSDVALPHVRELVRRANAFDALEVQRDALLVACETLVKVADEAHSHWDADRDSKVGKYLAAMAGHLTKYRADLDAAHAAIRDAKGDRP
jgi:hypothetical protein